MVDSASWKSLVSRNVLSICRHGDWAPVTALNEPNRLHAVQPPDAANCSLIVE